MRFVDGPCKGSHLLLRREEGLPELSRTGGDAGDAVVQDLGVGVVRHLHLGEGAGDAAEAIVVVVVGEDVGRPVVSCSRGCRAAVEVCFEGLGEVGLELVPAFVGIVKTVPLHYGRYEKAGLLDVVKPLVE